MRQESPLRVWQVHARSALAELLLEHPRALGESYWQHQRRATRFGATLIGAGAACLVHGLVPGLFRETGSSAVKSLYEQMLASKRLSSGTRRLTAAVTEVASAPQADYAGSLRAT
jgi:Family of unknown function (DUF6356)